MSKNGAKANKMLMLTNNKTKQIDTISRNIKKYRDAVVQM